MLKNFIAVLIALITSGFSSVGLADVAGSIVTIYSDESAVGSAVAVTKNILATNCRIGLMSANLQVKVSDILKPVSLLYADKARNVCFLKDEDDDFDSVYIKPAKTANVDDVVYVVGNPQGYWHTNFKGSITGKTTIDGNSLLVTNASISNQSAGGGVFDANGNLIAITMITNYEGRRTVLGIPSEVIIDYLNEHPELIKSAN